MDVYILKVRGWRKVLHVNGNHKKVGIAILIQDKIDFKVNTVTRNKDGHYIINKGSIPKLDIPIINIYAPNMLLLLSCFSSVRLCATP